MDGSTPSIKARQHAQDASRAKNNLGFLTDPWGKPCIRGQYFNNAGAYLRDRGVAAFPWTGWPMPTPMRNSPPIATTGLPPTSPATPTRMPAQRVSRNAAGDIAQYVAERRAEDAFDVIYVRPAFRCKSSSNPRFPID